MTDCGWTYKDHLGMINITSNIECGLGVIACSLPSLRRLFRCCNSSYDGKFNYSGDVSKKLGSYHFVTLQTQTEGRMWRIQFGLKFG